MQHHKVINIRGTHGSGKSSVVKDFMKKYGAKPIRKKLHTDLFNIGGQIEAYETQYKGTPVYIIGSYETQIGGCDQIETHDEVAELILKYHQRGHVVFEGITITSVYNRYLRLSPMVGGTIWAYLDTPLEVCLDRIMSRRRNQKTELFYIRSKFLAAASTMRNAIADGEIVVELDHINPLKDFLRILDGDLPKITNRLIEAAQREKKSPTLPTARLCKVCGKRHANPARCKERGDGKVSVVRR